MRLINSKNFIKIFRYIKIYGIFRTISKIVGRTRSRLPLWLFLSFPKYIRFGKTVGLIGCGHHAFSSIAFYLTTSTNAKISWAGDIDKHASSTLAFCYCSKDVHKDCSSPENVDDVDLVYIASNHSSHAEYASNYLNNGADVFIEKPIAVNFEQLKLLEKAKEKSDKEVFVGFNRPHASAIKLLKNRVKNNKAPVTLSCFIIGHVLPDDHWYRDPKEGTRVISNIAHWIDLAVHILFWRVNNPEYLDIFLTYSNPANKSENITINITSPNGDLINLTFSCRNEPFEGVNESINFQQDNIIAKIDDFRSIQIWQDHKYFLKKFRPKDNGHKACVLQPFSTEGRRTWNEIIHSTALTLNIDEMAKESEGYSRYYFKQNK